MSLAGNSMIRQSWRMLPLCLSLAFTVAPSTGAAESAFCAIQCPVPSFPGAVGFGATTPGGRGGPVVAVTSLADSGPGTLRWALADLDGPRIVVFAVEGVIRLQRQIAARGRLTLLGQVAPGAGVIVTGAALRIAGEDVIVRGMRIRPGDGPGQDRRARDALTVGARDAPVRRVVIDRNSFAWAPDENVNLWHGASDITISNNIIAEALQEPNEQRESLGMLVGDLSSRVSIAGNLFISNDFRNPTIAAATDVEVFNNYIYNFGQHAISVTMKANVFTRAEIIGNVVERGPSSGHPKAVRVLGTEGAGLVYAADNEGPDHADSTNPRNSVAASVASLLSAVSVVPPSGTPVLPSGQVRDAVLGTAGARWPALDPVDARLVAEARTGRGRLITTPAEAGEPVADPAAGRPFPLDLDRDFVPDAVEELLGSDPKTRDSHLSTFGSPYVPIELYAHILATGG